MSDSESGEPKEADSYMHESPDDPLGGIDSPGPHPPNTVEGAIPDSADFEHKPVESTFTKEEWMEITGNDPDSAHGVDLASGEDLTAVKKFVRIDPNSKWILTLPDDTDYETATRFADRVQDWWDSKDGSDFPIMVIGGAAGMEINLVRVDEHEIGPELVSCGAEHCPGHIVGEGEKCCEDLYCECEPDGDFAGQDYRCPASEERHDG